MERQPVAKTKTPTRAANLQRQSSGPSAPARSLVGLQSVIGNQAMRRLIDSPHIQTKLQISKPGDPFEQEADRVADSVMRTVEPGAAKGDGSQVQTQVLKPQITRVIQRRTPPLAVREDEEEREEDEPLSPTPIQRLCTGCEEEKQDTEVNPMVHRAAASDQVEAGSDLQQKLNSTKGSGTALPENARSSFESALGADFSGVKIHTGTDAVQMNKSLGAHAFTHGSDIYFNAGKFDPSSSTGKHLLAHELTHTIQQGSTLKTKKDTGAAEGGHLKTAAPSIQASWYNFDIPLTDYQFDPSLQGIKNAAGIVKDTAVAGVEWIVDEIKGLVSSAVDWLSEKWDSLKEFAASGLETAKGAFTSIIGLLQSPLTFIANAIMNFDADSLTAAWAGFTGIVNGVWEGFQAVTGKLLEQVSEIWEGINGYATSVLNKISSLTQNFLFKKLPDALQRLAHSVIDQLKSLWHGIYEGWNRVFKEIKTWVDSALDTVLQFVTRITSFAIDVVINGIKQFGQLILFIQDLFANPGKYLAILAEQSVAAFDGLETRFAGIVSQYFGEEKAEPAAAPTQAIQLQPDPGAVPEEKTSASWSDIGTGVWELMVKKWNEFKSNPLSIVKTLLLDMFLPIVGNIEDIIGLVVEIKKIVTGPLSAGSLEELWTSFLLILDIPIIIQQKVVSILMRSLMLPLIVASFIPHPLVKGIAAAVGFGLLGAFVEIELLNVGHKVLLLKTAKTTQDQKTDAYNRVADTFIALIMTGAIIAIMLLLHFIANVMKGVYSFIKGKVFPVEKVPVEAKGGKPGKGKGGPEEGKTGEGKSAKEAASQDGKRKVKMNEKGLCEVCASPCAEVREKYRSVMTPEAEAKLKAIESDPALSDAQKLDKLKPIEQELADLLKQKGPGTPPRKGPYSHIPDDVKVEPGRPFQPSQKPKILDANRSNNGGKLRPDNPADPWFGKDLAAPPKGPFEPGKFPEVPKNQAQVDHIQPRIGPDGKPLGSNSYGNAEVVSAEFNNMKRNKL